MCRASMFELLQEPTRCFLAHQASTVKLLFLPYTVCSLCICFDPLYVNKSLNYICSYKASYYVFTMLIHFTMFL